MKSKRQRIERIKISAEASILEALKKMDENFKRLLLVFDGEKFINNIIEINFDHPDSVEFSLLIYSPLRERL